MEAGHLAGCVRRKSSSSIFPPPQVRNISGLAQRSRFHGRTVGSRSTGTSTTSTTPSKRILSTSSPPKEAAQQAVASREDPEPPPPPPTRHRSVLDTLRIPE